MEAKKRKIVAFVSIVIMMVAGVFNLQYIRIAAALVTIGMNNYIMTNHFTRFVIIIAGIMNIVMAILAIMPS